MKSFKLLLLLGLLTVTGCDKDEVKEGTPNQETPASDVTKDDTKENNTSNDNNSTENSTENNSEDNNNTNNDNSNTTDDNNTTEQEITYTVNFYNPSCGSFDTTVLNERLKTYINSSTTSTFVTEIKNTSCQVTNDIPTKGNKVLQIGAASTSGSLEIFFSAPIKKFTITVQTYHKPYVETWNNNKEVANVDPNSMLSVTGDATIPVSVIDLTSEDEEPVEKTVEFKDFNCNKLHLMTTNAEKGRVFIKEIKFVL